jgi:hypothetical protein
MSTLMKKALMSTAGALALGAAVALVTVPADARGFGGFHGGGFHGGYGGYRGWGAAGVLGGLALGSALAAPYYAYGYGYGYPYYGYGSCGNGYYDAYGNYVYSCE